MTTSQIYPLELVDETLDINATDNYDLTLELSEEGVSLAILDPLRGKYVMLRYYPLETAPASNSHTVTDIFDTDDFLKKNYRKVFITVPSLQYTLVPTPVYEPGLKEDYFNFNFNSPAHSDIFSNVLPFPDAIVLFSPPEEIREIVSSHWHNATIWHHTKPLLQHVFSASRNYDDLYIHLHFEKNFITVIITEKRSLIFCNTFSCSASSDAAYFLFNVLERKEIRKDETIYLSGTIEPYSETHLSLLTFASNIKFATPIIRHSFSYVMNEIHLHRWLNLFTAASCE